MSRLGRQRLWLGLIALALLFHYGVQDLFNASYVYGICRREGGLHPFDTLEAKWGGCLSVCLLLAMVPAFGLSFVRPAATPRIVAVSAIACLCCLLVQLLFLWINIDVVVFRGACPAATPG